MDSRFCKKCGIEKSIDRFPVISIRGKNGKIYWEKMCNACKNIKNQSRSSYKEYHIRNKNNKEYIERKKQYVLQYRGKNREKINLINKEWRKSNGDKWQALNRANQHRRRALDSIDVTAWLKKLKIYNKCLSCNRDDIKLTIDHKKPIIMGGTNHIDNLQPLCLFCNKRKFTKTIDYELAIT